MESLPLPVSGVLFEDSSHVPVHELGDFRYHQYGAARFEPGNCMASDSVGACCLTLNEATANSGSVMLTYPPWSPNLRRPSSPTWRRHASTYCATGKNSVGTLAREVSSTGASSSVFSCVVDRYTKLPEKSTIARMKTTDNCARFRIQYPSFF